MENKLNQIDLNVKEIEKKLRKNGLDFIDVKRNDVENRISFPMFVDSFYKYIDVYGDIPTQKEYFDYYISLNENCQNIQKLNIDQFEGLRARVYRTYPSLIRDLHFAKVLDEKTAIDEVIYNQELDVGDGIDILLKENGFKYGLALYTNTRRAKMKRQEKIEYRDDKEDYIYVELPLKFDGAREINDFYLYGTRELITVLNIILETQKKAG